MKQLIKDFLAEKLGYEEELLVEELVEIIEEYNSDALATEYVIGYNEGYAEGEKYGFNDGYEVGTGDALAHANIDED